MKITLGTCAFALLLFGCEDLTSTDAGTDTGSPPGDTGTSDTGTTDTGTADTGTMMGCAPASGAEIRVGGTTAAGRFAPTSDQIAVVAFEGFSATGIEVLDLCGDTVASIDTGDPPRNFIAWSSDGSTLYYVDAAGISSIPVAGGTPTALVADAATFDLSPDGTTIVYSDSGDLFTWDVAGGAPTDLMQTGRFPRYSADGAQVAFSDDGMLKILTVADGTVEDVTTLDSAAFQPLDWFSDGSLAIVSSDGLQRVTPDPSGATVEMIAAVSAAQDVDVSPDDSLIAYRINGTLPTIILGL